VSTIKGSQQLAGRKTDRENSGYPFGRRK